MPDPKRRRTIALGVASVIAATIVWTNTGDDAVPPTPGPPKAPPAGNPPRPTTTTSTEIEELATSGPSNPATAVELDGLARPRFIHRERRRALQVARRFLDGYFAFEVRDDWRWGARQIAATATTELASELLAGGATLPPVMDEMPPQAEIDAIDLEFDKPPTTAQVRAEVTRGSDRSGIGVIAQRKDTRWVITQIVE